MWAGAPASRTSTMPERLDTPLGTLEFIDAATGDGRFGRRESLGSSFETRSSSAVDVAISVTTIPAAAFMGAAIALHDVMDPPMSSQSSRPTSSCSS